MAAAENPGGGAAGAGMGVGAGFAMANQMGQAFAHQQGAAFDPAQTGQQSGPPPPPTPQYHVAENGQTTGPFTLAQLRQQAKSGTFSRETMVWSEGMSGWTKAGDVDTLRPIVGPTPPPPPPPPAS